MAYSESDVIAAVEGATPLSVQTKAQSEGTPTNTKAKLLYASGSRTQGNFSLFYAQAKVTLANDLSRSNIKISEVETPLALAYCIWDLGIKKFPDWEAQTVSPGGTESVTRSKPGITSAKAAYLDILRSAKKSEAKTPLVQNTDDYKNYPQELNPSPIDNTRLAGDG